MTIQKGALNFGDAAAQDVSLRIYGAVDAETDLDNIPENKRYDGMGAIVIGDSTLWFFDKDSVAAEASGSVREPAVGTGRWLRVGASTSAAITTLISDLASTANGKGASDIGVEDAAGNLTATNVEAALAEIFARTKAGTGTLNTGTATINTATITANSRIIVSMKDPGAGAITGFASFEVPAASRVVGAPGSFVVNAIDDAKALIATAACTFDWVVIG